MSWVYRRPFDYAQRRRRRTVRRIAPIGGAKPGPACITAVYFAKPAVSAVNFAKPAISAVNLDVPSVSAVWMEACE